MLTVKRLFSALMVTTLFLSLSVTAFAANAPLGKVVFSDKGVQLFELNNIEREEVNNDEYFYYSKEATIKVYPNTTGYSLAYYSNVNTADKYWQWRYDNLDAAEEMEIQFKNEIKLTEPGVYYFSAVDAPDDFVFEVDDPFSLPINFCYIIIDPSIKAHGEAKQVNTVKAASSVVVDGEKISFDAYNIEGNNYFKLRDIAKVLSGTQKQFEVAWDNDAKAINLVSGAAYTVVGGELEAGLAGTPKVAPNTSVIFKDGVKAELKAYNINGNNYFKLRDLGQAFNFAVTWDGATNTINIDTSKAYTA